MSNLYGKELAKVFDKMYQGFIDYNEEYNFYSTLCNNNNAQSVIEIACGSGNLAEKFTTNFNNYHGLDYSEHMISIAKEKLPNSKFTQGDMRAFTMNEKFDAALITGRSINYLKKDEEISSAFNCIDELLTKKGVLIFDCIDASKFIPFIADNKYIEHRSCFEDVNYLRETKWYWEKNMDGFLINWSAKYYEEKPIKNKFLGKDKSIFRVFTRNEIELLLKMNSYKVLNIIDRKSYAFDTFVIIATK